MSIVEIILNVIILLGANLLLAMWACFLVSMINEFVIERGLKERKRVSPPQDIQEV